jgi:soluble lytic murein transglycosylase-like protein
MRDRRFLIRRISSKSLALMTLLSYTERLEKGRFNHIHLGMRMEKTGTRGYFLTRVVLGVLLSFTATAWGDPAATPSKPAASPQARTVNPKLRKSLEEEMKKQEQARAERRARSNVRIFKDKSGVPTFTNRLDKYRTRPGFTEVRLQFEPIVVEATYRRLKETDRYNAGSIEDLVTKHADRWGLDKNLIFAVIKAESNFRQDAVSPAGACGLMQLMPGTAGEMGVDDIFDPAENIAGGTQYLAKLMALFDNDIELALAGYNAGPQTVINCGRKVPNIKETRNYVKKVQEYLLAFNGHKELPTYVKATKNTRKIVTPTGNETLKTIYFKSGLTQPVEKVIDQHPDYYYVTFKGRMWSVPKRLVEKIV